MKLDLVNSSSLSKKNNMKKLLYLSIVPIILLTSCNNKIVDSSSELKEEHVLLTIDTSNIPEQIGSGYPEDQIISIEDYKFAISKVCTAKGKFESTLGSEGKYLQLKKQESSIIGMSSMSLTKIIIEEYINSSSYSGDLTQELVVEASNDKTNYNTIASTKEVHDTTWTLTYDLSNYNYVNFLNESNYAIYLSSITIYGY